MPKIDEFQRRVWEMQERDGGCNGTSQCGGIGCITANVPVNHPAFGRAFTCICRRQESLMRMMSITVQSDAIPADSYQHDFASFEGARMEYAERALRYARQLENRGQVFDEDKGRIKQGFLVIGPPGCGKTTLISIVYRGYLTAGKSVGWWNTTAFVKRVQSTYKRDYDGPGYEDILAAVNSLDFLVYDDIGSPTLGEKPLSEDHIEIILRVLNFREARKLPTAFTSNCSLKALEAQYGPRNYSRIRGLCAVALMKGPDFRQANNNE